MLNFVRAKRVFLACSLFMFIDWRMSQVRIVKCNSDNNSVKLYMSYTCTYVARRSQTSHWLLD